MECNRDEAIRAKTIAEKKLADKDFAGAKKFTLKAQSLYPELDGISQILIALNVYISSENKVNGESDWYGVLDVNPSDDEETIRKQYRKLALMLHPDKNKSVGADGAFKILSEAWSLLSDKAKRSAYNQRRNSRGIHEKVKLSPQSGRPSTSLGVNGVNKAASKPTNRNSAASTRSGPGSAPYRSPPPPPPPPPASTVVHEGDTFWTVCRRCKMHYEYLKVYVNRTILCPTCQKPFLAVEMAPPVNFPKAGSDENGSSAGGGGVNTKVPCSRTKVASKAANERVKRRKGEGEGELKMKRNGSGR
ncbi:hypothetical protein L6452_05253 [Arctium lappa]|uniref:Uncharacterized protein n=1 Tax=Arctium lappa TaxID=4217 RepID=A0ACB9EFV8_ARCLA|nr:hypothetical protein L6452_05253 [Arctium lappa]